MNEDRRPLNKIQSFVCLFTPACALYLKINLRMRPINKVTHIPNTFFSHSISSYLTQYCPDLLKIPSKQEHGPHEDLSRFSLFLQITYITRVAW